jgi:hypothetical protein
MVGNSGNNIYSSALSSLVSRVRVRIRVGGHRLDWTGLDRTGLDWTGLDYECECCGLGQDEGSPLFL